MNFKKVVIHSLQIIFALTILVIINGISGRKVKAEITVSNPKTDYVVRTSSQVYNSRLKKVSFKTRGKMRGKSVPVAEASLECGKFINVLGTKNIKGKDYYRIGRNQYIRKDNVINYPETKARISSEEQDENFEFNDDEFALSNLIEDIDGGLYDTDPSYATFDDSVYHNRMIKNAKKLLGYFTYGTGANRIKFGNWRHPRKHGKTDCSGFVWLIMKKSGCRRVGNWPFFTAPMETDAKHHHRYLRKISAKNIRPGDVVIANTGNGLGNNGHAAIIDSKYDGMDTQIIEMGGDSNGPVHRSTIGYSLSQKLLKGRITYARVVR